MLALIHLRNKSVIEDSVKGLQSLIGGLNNAISDMAVQEQCINC